MRRGDGRTDEKQQHCWTSALLEKNKEPQKNMPLHEERGREDYQETAALWNVRSSEMQSEAELGECCVIRPLKGYVESRRPSNHGGFKAYHKQNPGVKKHVERVRSLT